MGARRRTSFEAGREGRMEQEESHAAGRGMAVLERSDAVGAQAMDLETKGRDSDINGRGLDGVPAMTSCS